MFDGSGFGVSIRELSLSPNLLVGLFVGDSCCDSALACHFLAVKDGVLKRSFSSSGVKAPSFRSLFDIQRFCALSIGVFFPSLAFFAALLALWAQQAFCNNGRKSNFDV